MDLNVLDPNNALRRVLTFAAAVPTSSTLASLNAALQTLKDGGSGLQWVASGASSALVFANRNVVVPLLKAATPTGCSSSGLHRAADPAADAGQLQFAQTARRRRGGGRIVLQQKQPAAVKGKSKKKAAASASGVGLYSLSLQDPLDGSRTVPCYGVPDEEEQHESLQVMHMGLQSSML